MNRIRREHPALQRSTNLRFYGSDDAHVLWYGKTDGDDAIFVAVNLDPSSRHASMVDVPIDELGMAPDTPYRMRELLSDTTYEWRGPRAYVDLDPSATSAQIFWLVR